MRNFWGYSKYVYRGKRIFLLFVPSFPMLHFILVHHCAHKRERKKNEMWWEQINLVYPRKNPSLTFTTFFPSLSESFWVILFLLLYLFVSYFLFFPLFYVHFVLSLTAFFKEIPLSLSFQPSSTCILISLIYSSKWWTGLHFRRTEMHKSIS